MRVRTIAGLLAICIVASVVALPKSDGGRLPGDVYDEIMRAQVLGPGATVPSAEFILISAGSITAAQIGELAALGLSVKASAKGYTRVQGPLTSFAMLGPNGEGLPWVEAVIPAAGYRSDDAGLLVPDADKLSVEELLAALGVDKLHEQGIKGQGVKIAVFDGGFTGELGGLLPGHVQYLEVAWDGDTPQLIERYEYEEHGEACAQAIAAIAPLATFYLVTVNDPIDIEAIIGFLRDGTLHFDVISESIGWIVPADHGDGRGILAAQAEELVDMGIAFYQSSGNYSAGQTTSSSFYTGVFSNSDETAAGHRHDFDPSATDAVDRNTLAIEVAPWDEGDAALCVILEWDGWPWQVKDNPRIWTRDSILRIQDLDLQLYYKDSAGPRKVAAADTAQLAALYVPIVPLQPVEVLMYDLERPGTYLIAVENSTLSYSKEYEPFERAAEFHLYVMTAGTKVTMEHNTPEGSLLNVSAARVVTVGAAGRTGAAWSVMSFSSRGPTTDGRAKPEYVTANCYWSPVIGDYFAGTSAAAPVAAGVGALLRESWPLFSWSQLQAGMVKGARALCGSGSANGPCESGLAMANNVVGYGLLDAWQAWQTLSGK